MDTNDQYFDWLCRTCMNELVEATSYDDNTNPQQQWQSIFDRFEECAAFRIAELLTNAVPQIEVQPRDELPKRICCKCLQQLLIVYRFQQMCIQSEQQMRQQVPKKQSDLEIPMIGATMEGEIETNNAGSYPLTSLQTSSTHQNMEHSSIQESLLETTEQMIKPEAAETSNDDIDKLLEDCRDAEGNFSEFLKNEPNEDDEPEFEYSNDGTTNTAISEKDEQLSIEFEEQQINETNVKKHHSRQAEDKRYKCPYCRRKFNTISNMYQHKARHEGACDICGKTILKKNLTKHKLTHSNEKAHKCDFCGKRFKHITYLRSHIRKHTGEKPYKCKYCECSFHDRSNHISHMRVHFGDNIYRCELCPLAFPAAINLRAHSTEHKNEDSETRERNMKALQEAEAKLQLPLSKKHKPVQKGAKCDFCGKCYAVMSALRRHMRKHSGEKPYKCKYCVSSFYDPTHRMKHMRVHLGDNIYRCELCPLAFPLTKELRAHLTEHNNDDVETRERNMKALKEAEVKLQLRLSKKHKPVQKAAKCDFCGKCFTRIIHLHNHIRTHTDEKPYKCKYCKRSYTSGGALMFHMRRHLGDNVHRCDLCPLAFPLAKELRAHLTEHNNDDAETRERNMKALKEAEAKLQLELSKT